MTSTVEQALCACIWVWICTSAAKYSRNDRLLLAVHFNTKTNANIMCKLFDGHLCNESIDYLSDALETLAFDRTEKLFHRTMQSPATVEVDVHAMHLLCFNVRAMFDDWRYVHVTAIDAHQMHIVCRLTVNSFDSMVRSIECMTLKVNTKISSSNNVVEEMPCCATINRGNSTNSIWLRYHVLI